MTTLSITNNIEIVWKIKGFDQYGFGKNKLLYNIKTGRIIKATIVGYSKGFWINKKFLTFVKIKSLLYKPKKDFCPF